MRKARYYIYLIFAAVVFAASSAQALEIPSYIVDIERPYKNIDSIIEALTSNAINADEAADAQEHNNIMQRQLAASAYAQALTARIRLIRQAKDAEKTARKKKLKKSTPGGADNKKAVLAQDVQPVMRSIAEHLNSIVSLEAAQANLEGTMLLNSLPRNYNLEDEDAEEAE